MMEKLDLSFTRLLLQCYIVFLFVSSLLSAQNSNLQSYQYISPVPGSSLNKPETNIIIRKGSFINPATLSSKKIKVVGSKSGVHSYKIKLADDDKTILIKPDSKFSLGETVYINYIDSISSREGVRLPWFDFQFKIVETDISTNKNRSIDDILDLKDKRRFLNRRKRKGEVFVQDNIEFPPDYPVITIANSNNPSPGYFFLAPFFYPSQLIGYLMILDNNGIPVFYQRTYGVKADWKRQPNGLLTFFDLPTHKFYAMDSSYSIIDTFSTGNGYDTDIHELRLLSNGHALLQAYDNETIRMDTIVEGGNPNAIVTGLIIQEIDTDKNVVFQWRSWDHFKITDATEDIDMTSSYIDYVHSNAIEVDADSNLLISCRHMDEITKIDKASGNIIWRWGGAKSKNNQFTFINDPVTFSHQHNIRLLPDGNYTLFDNGNLHTPTYSRSLEYKLDQTDTTAELVLSFQNDPATFSFAMGNTQRLANNSTVIGWGWSSSDARAITEVDNDNSVALEIYIPDSSLSYRAFKFPWKTNLFVTNRDSVFFDSVFVGDSSSVIVDIKNNSKDSLTITGFYYADSVFSVTVDSLPFIIPPFESVPVTISFKPLKYGYYSDVLHIRSDTDTSRIAQLLVMTGKADSIPSGVNDYKKVLSFRLNQNYPNPFNPVTTIEFEIPSRELVSLKVFDVRGREVVTLVSEERTAGLYKVKLDASNLSTGIYFYRLQAGSFFEVKKLLLLK